MPTTNATSTKEVTNAFTDAIVSSVKQGQELAFSGISAWVDLTGKTFALPKADSLPFAGALPNPREFVEASFGFYEELLATQKEFAIKLADAVAPK
jgi:hypothetical protein